jgi:hypothetical protein
MTRDCGLTKPCKIWELRPAMNVHAILSAANGAAPAAAGARAQAWRWWHDSPSAAARLHRW